MTLPPLNSPSRPLLVSLSPCLLVLCVTLSVSAQDWSRFRGPNGTGLADAPALPAAWSDTDYRWRITLPGTGHSSPVVVGDRLFVTCCDAATATRTILCINPADGAVRWRRDYPGKPFRQHVDNSFASSTPAADANNIYVCWTTPEDYFLLALTHDGKELWRVNLGKYTSQHGNGTSPILFDDLVIVTNDQENTESFILAVDRKTGQTRWKTPRKSTHMAASTPCIYQPQGQPAQLIVTSRTEGVTALDPHTGQRLWQVTDLFNFRVIASPAIADGLIIANCGEGPNGKMLVAVRPPASLDQKPQVAWKTSTQIPYVPSPLAKGPLLFTLTDTGTLTCFRAATGDVIWQQRIGGAYYASPICVNDRLYCISKKGEVLVVAAADKFQELGRATLGETCFATPAVASGRMYIRTLSHLYCLGK